MFSLKDHWILTFAISLTTIAIMFLLVSCSRTGDHDPQYTTTTVTTAAQESVTEAVTTQEQVPDETPVENQDKYYCVTDYGVKGDGVTDDTEAIQAIFDMLEDGGTVYFPSGKYWVTKSLYVKTNNTTIYGNGKTTHVLFTYEQKETDSGLSASLFCFGAGLRDIVFKDMKLEYEGEFFPEFGDSYKGKVSGLYFMRNYDVIVENVEIFGFNANGIYAGATTLAYSKNIMIDKCNLHHNRVAGVLFGNVDGLSLTNTLLEYNGSQPDGGTGYGCAGSSGAIPKNVQIIGNRANYNYRKGIDLHAGNYAIIDGNICTGNRLYGIYTEGRNTSDIIISNNIINGMKKEKLDIGSPYTWIAGISIGVWETGNDQFTHNYTITGNIVKDFGLTQGDAYPIFVYHSYQNGHIQIKDNILMVDNVSHLVRFSRGGTNSDYDISLDISGNQATVTGRVIGAPIYLGYYNKLNVFNNQITFKKPLNTALVYIGNKEDCQAFYAFNNITVPDYGDNEQVVLENPGSTVQLVKMKNFLNGELTD